MMTTRHRITHRFEVLARGVLGVTLHIEGDADTLTNGSLQGVGEAVRSAIVRVMTLNEEADDER